MMNGEPVLLSCLPSNDRKPTARRAIKSFVGDSKGGGFSKESPLAAGGKETLMRDQDGQAERFLS
jgi:hypothetical protein